MTANASSQSLVLVSEINKNVEFSTKTPKICKDASKEIIIKMIGEYLRGKDSKKVIYLT